ncbi:unnamed protein product [Rhizoctonia solani]|uniref:Uncharacterized protein n=1 Tax=Rhizoctonia solani TaxID=456999 RepID=A0A8H3GC85_9AGAM|nr:unnamed protein product [Rhizoctonia solani]
MSPTPTTGYSSAPNPAHTGNEPMLAVTGGQPMVTNISTGKKGLAGSVIAGAVIGGIVVTILLVAVFFALRHRHRRSRGQTASTASIAEAAPENEQEQEKCTEVESSLGHSGSPVSVAPCPSCGAYPPGVVPGAQNPTVVNQSRPIASPQRSFDSSSNYLTQISYSNVATHAPRPQSYQMCPRCAPSMPPPVASRSTSAGLSVRSPKEGYQTYDRQPYISSASPPLPPGAMPPLPSPGLDSYAREFKPSPSPQSPPPQSPSSPGGSSIRRWIMSPLSRSGTVNTALPPYERPASGLQRQESEKKDESAMAASVYAFM